MPEFQGRLPIRIVLNKLSENQLYKLMTKKEKNLIQEQNELFKTENFDLIWEDEALHEIAKITYECNETEENIGARRLITVIEKILENISLDASKSIKKKKKSLIEIS